MNIFYHIATTGLSWINKNELNAEWKDLGEWKDKLSAISGFKIILVFSNSPDVVLAKHAGRIHFTEHNCQYILITTAHLPETKNLEMLAAGFSDVIVWNGSACLLDYLDEKAKRWIKIEEVLSSVLITKNLIGGSKAWKSFLRNVIEVSIFSGSNILILGESGTGKELLSRLVHMLDERQQKSKLILLDCSSIAPELSGSEFFGHEKGAYTSAVGSREGAFSLANKGTLFLDEIGELPLRMQAELLRVIQEGNFKKVGSNVWQNTSFRLVSATNKDLKSMIGEKVFRNDLYYRISDVELCVPSLNERIEDVRPLSEHFLREFYKENNKPDDVPYFDENVIQLLEKKEYTGNVRELRQLIRRMAMRHTGKGKITMGDMPAGDRLIKNKMSIEEKLNELESVIKKAVIKGENLFEIKNLAAFVAIKVALELESGNRQKAAGRLNITTRAIQQYFKKNTDEWVVLNN
ncbi:MAG: sigma 54-interacting transcriptional regulator [Bacteroidia bacterium]